MHLQLKKLLEIEAKVKENIVEKQLKINIPNIVAVSKTFPIEEIMPLIEHGHIHFGENKVQEAENKWLEIKNQHQNVKLHLVGRLQSNKAKHAVKIFDYFHALDSKKLADKISSFEKIQSKKLKHFIQINFGDEAQKGGIPIKNLKEFYVYCTEKASLDVIGLMCLPPINSNTENYFKQLKELAKSLNLKELSMGMSSDYMLALKHEASYLRLGSCIFGERKT